MIIKIDNAKVDITWENNNSVQELLELAKNGIEVEMTRYGGFEQVGNIGKSISNNDEQMSTVPGDVVLYNSKHIVIFFGTNSWSYTKLGNINLTQKELVKLLDKSNVVLSICE